MRRALLASLALGCAIAGVAVADDSTPPVIQHLKVTPKKVCREASSTCQHPGGTVTFTVSEYSDVIAATRPLGVNVGPVIVFRHKYTAGTHSEHFSAKGFRTGKWSMQLTAVDKANNRSHPKDRTYHVVK